MQRMSLPPWLAIRSGFVRPAGFFHVLLCLYGSCADLGVGRQCGICTRRAFLGTYTRPFFTPALLGTIAAKWMPMRSSVIRATCGIGIAPSSRFSRLQSAWRRRVQSFCSGTHRQNCIVPPNNSMERTAVKRLSRIGHRWSAVSHLSR